MFSLKTGSCFCCLETYWFFDLRALLFFVVSKVNSRQGKYCSLSLRSLVSVFLLLQTHTHTQRTHPSIISWAIHRLGQHTKWTHSSHNYCGGSHTLHQSIPVSKRPGENSERIKISKRYYEILIPRSKESQRRRAGFTKLQSDILTDSYILVQPI